MRAVANPMSTADQVAELILECAADGTLERTIPRSTGYMARLGNAFPLLRRALVPLLERRGRRVKQQYRNRARTGGAHPGVQP